MNIQQIIGGDIPIILSWWGEHKARPTPDMLPDTTYMISVQGTPIASASLFLTNCRYAAMIEHVIANPIIDKPTKRAAVDALFRFLEAEAKRRGYKAVTIFSYVDKVKARYESLGFQQTLTNVTTFSKLI